VTIVAGEENRPPVVDAGPDGDVELPNQVLTMAGSVTDDGLPLGVPLDTRWFQISGPAAVSYFDRTSPVTDITFSLPGTYILSLEGREELSASDTVVVTVHPENVGPTVSAGADQTIFSSVTILSGSASDPDGLPLAGTLVTTWSQVSGPAPVVFADAGAVSTTASFGATGSYVLRLRADDGALAASDEVVVEVDVTNAPPLVEAGPDQTLVFPSSAVTLSGSVTDDGLPAGGSLSVVWNLLSAPAPAVFSDRSSLTTGVSFTAGGSYLFRLDASDTELVGSDTVTVVVEDASTAPRVDAGADQSIVLPVSSVSLGATATDDGLPAGSVLSYRWTTVSGPAVALFQSPEAPATPVRFEQAGTYVLRLTVSDGALSSSDELTVEVRPAPAGPPPAVALTSPADRQGVTDFTEVVGTVTSADLLSWKLEARREGTDDFIRIASDRVEKTNAVLGTFDPTLLRNGLFSPTALSAPGCGRSSGARARARQRRLSYPSHKLDRAVPGDRGRRDRP